MGRVRTALCMICLIMSVEAQPIQRMGSIKKITENYGGVLTVAAMFRQHLNQPTDLDFEADRSTLTRYAEMMKFLWSEAPSPSPRSDAPSPQSEAPSPSPQWRGETPSPPPPGHYHWYHVFGAGVAGVALGAGVAFLAMGDPLICPLYGNGSAIEHECVNYTGPAAVQCFNVEGDLESVDFIGVCDEDGKNCLADDAYWVGEQWRFDLQTQSWKYRDARGSHLANVSCDNSWLSEKSKWARPEPKWLRSFHGKRSFILDARQARVLDGPKSDIVERALVNATKGVYDQLDVPGAEAWVSASLAMIGHGKAHNIKSPRVDVLAQYVVMYGLVKAKGRVTSRRMKVEL